MATVLDVPDPTVLEFNAWADELMARNSDVPVTPPHESHWRMWANFVVADYLQYPSHSGYKDWKSWAAALITIDN